MASPRSPSAARESVSAGKLDEPRAENRRPMKTGGRYPLTTAALLSFGIALLHVAMIVVGSPAYLYFGAAGLARLDAQGSVIPAAMTLGITIVFVVLGLYALAGAGIIGRLPFLRVGLVVVATLYGLRGLVVVLDLARRSRGAGYPLRQTVFSAVSLGMGLLYFAGVLGRWRELAPGHRDREVS